MHPFYRAGIVAVLWLALAGAAAGQVRLSDRSSVRFATRQQGIAAITADDPFTRNLSRFDLQARMRTDREVTLEDWKEFVAKEVRGWSEEEQGIVKPVVDSVRDRLAKFTFPLPDDIYLVSSTGNEEGGAAYCRGNHIVLPITVLKRDRGALESLLIHELFHVLSSQHPELRKELYAIVGFQQCSEIPIHPSLKDRRITNPDAPSIDCTIELKDGDRLIHAAPVLYSSTETFDPAKKGGLFSYLEFRLMVVEPDGRHWKPLDKNDRAVVLDPKGSREFNEKIGRNTNYIVHPEEILADNFVHLVLGREKLPTPRIVEELRRVLEKR